MLAIAIIVKTTAVATSSPGPILTSQHVFNVALILTLKSWEVGPAWDEAATAVVFKPDKLPTLYIILYYGYANRHLGTPRCLFAQPPHVYV